MTAQTFSNNGQTTLTAPVLSGDTSISVASALTFPAGVPYTILIDQEYMLVTAGAGSTTWGVTRGVEGTLAAPHAAGPGPGGANTVFQDFTLGGLQSLNDGFWPFLRPSGLAGATQASRYVGATATGPPGSGSFLVGDFVIDQSGAIWICFSAGSPGTWRSVGAGIWHARMYLATAASIPGTFPGTRVPYDSIDFDPAGMCTTGPSAKITVPVAGVYTISMNVGYSISQLDGTRNIAEIIRTPSGNTPTYDINAWRFQDVVQGGGIGFGVAAGTEIASLVAGDQITGWAYTSQAGSLLQGNPISGLLFNTLSVTRIATS